MNSITAKKLKKNPFYKPSYLQEGAIERLNFSEEMKEKKKRIEYNENIIAETKGDNEILETGELNIHDNEIPTHEVKIKKKRKRKKKVEEENGQTE
jgi:hypothetical protein